MAYDVFTNAVWGVRLDDGDQAVLNERLALELEELHDDDEDERPQDEAVERIAEDKSLVVGLREKYGAPKDAGLHYSGDADDRPGRCQTEAEVWLLGYGMYAFPGTEVPKDEFLGRAEWHTWVEGG